MVLLARISPAIDGEERRRDARRVVTLTTSLAQPSSENTEIRILNLSRTGLLLETEAALEVGEIFLLDLPELGATSVRIRRKDGPAYGCEFLAPVTQAAVSAALLKSSGPTQAETANNLDPEAPRITLERNPREPRAAMTFAIAVPFGILLVGIAFTLAFMQVG